MTIQEIQQLQVGNLIMIGEMVAMVDRITRVTHMMDPIVDKVMRIYEGHYISFENMEDGIGWFTTDNPEYNASVRCMSLEHFHGIPIPPNFEEINNVHLWNDPKAVENYQYIHLYQNEWNRYEGIKDDWKRK